MGRIATGGVLAAVFAVWVVLVPLPLGLLYTDGAAQMEPAGEVGGLLVRSVLLAGAVAGVAVVLGYVPGRIMGTAGRGRGLLLVLLLMPLLLPRYVLYYAWSLLLSPTSALGLAISSRPELARAIGTGTSTIAMILWYWPLAALLIGQGFRMIDKEAWNLSRLDAGPVRRFFAVVLPLLARPIALALGVCFVLALSEFGTFHLAGVRTVGTELAVLYELTGSGAAVARAAWPLAAAALVAGVMLWRRTQSWAVNVPAGGAPMRPGWWCWVILAGLLGVSLLAPVGLLLANRASAVPLWDVVRLHFDELGWSLVTACLASILALVLATGPMAAYRFGRPGRWLAAAAYSTTFLAMFLPGSLVAIGLLKLVGRVGLAGSVGQNWCLVAAGQGVRFAGIALIVFRLAGDSLEKHFGEMASVDGASGIGAWRSVHLPRLWPVLVGVWMLVGMLSLTELSATMVLLPAGLPNFAQRLLNQMHYARDQEVIASCLMLVGLYVVLAGGAVVLARLARARIAAVVVAALMVLVLTGCQARRGESGPVEVVASFGQTGRGPGEFVYPRAIDLADDGTVFVADKTGRIQRLSQAGEFLSLIRMPQFQTGKPTGISLAPDGNLYVADTHYHRVMIFSPAGELLGQFGRFGQGDGEFIYPTDIAFGPDRRIYVSEYGGNDRVSVFSSEGRFSFSFGGPGRGRGEFARPSALCVDGRRGRLYVADAVNHRVAVYSLDGELKRYIGSPGRAEGQLRYPYDLALMPDGTLVVCEYGNNRLQLFSPDGASKGTFGSPGRQLGQLAYPWGVSVDRQGRAYVVDAGNNRVQVWQL